MSPLLLAAPLFVPLLTAVLCLLLEGERLRHGIGMAGALGLLVAGLLIAYGVDQEGVLLLQMGSWPAPFGIVLVADAFAGLMLVLAGVIAVAGIGYHLAVEARDESDARIFMPAVHFLLLGVCGAFLTGDLFNLFVWFEVMLMASFVLLGKGGRRDQSEAAVKYVAMNLVASGLFLSGIGIIYGSTGTVNMADLARTLETATVQGGSGVEVASVLLVVAFGIKAGLFPLFFWLPASYHTAPVAVNAIFAGLLTKVGVYALIRVYTLVFPVGSTFIHPLLLGLGVATMVVGVLGALAQMEVRRILSFHIVSQIGYMVLGLGIGTALAMGASVFYIAHNIVVKSNLLLVCGFVARLGGSEHLQDLGGFRSSRPVLAALFLIPALSLAGMPPLSGFFAKLGIVVACLEQREYLVAAAALGVGMLTLLSMLKIWNQVFAAEAPAERQVPQERSELRAIAGMLWLTAITIAIGLLAGPLFAFCMQAGEQLTGHLAYREAVLGERP